MINDLRRRMGRTTGRVSMRHMLPTVSRKTAYIYTTVGEDLNQSLGFNARAVWPVSSFLRLYVTDVCHTEYDKSIKIDMVVSLSLLIFFMFLL